jgi:hypothetical protein
VADDNQQDGNVQNEPDGTQQPEPDANNTEGQTDGQREPQAPWEREGQQFDPATAWKLIQNLREENGTLKHRNGELADKNRAYEDAKLTETERTQRDLDEANQKIARLEADNAWAQALAAHPALKPEDRELVGDGTPEQIEARAAKLATRYAAQAATNANGNPFNRAHPTGGTDPTIPPRHSDWMREALEENN